MAGHSRWAPRALAVFLATTLIGLFFSIQFYLAFSGYNPEITWGASLRASLAIWYSWGLLVWPVLWIAGRFPIGPGRWQRNGVIHLLASIIVTMAHALLCASFYWVVDAPAKTLVTWLSAVRFQLLMYGHWDMLIYAAMVGLEHAVRHHRLLRERERQAGKLESQLVRARLDALRMQLNPHFLFNSLNAVAELIHEDPQKAERVIERLGGLLRKVLEDPDSPDIPLRDELAFAEEYLRIEQIRFGDRLSIDIVAPDETLDIPVPRLILQPLVENAIRHGIAPCEDRGTVAIQSSQEDGALQLQVRNSGDTGQRNRARGAGRGLVIVRQRLAAQFGSSELLTTESTSQGGFIARLTIPLPTSAGAPATNPSPS